MDARRVVAVATGAVLGASLRWGITRLAGPDALDAALLAVNLVGCLLLGVVSQLPPHAMTSRAEAFLGAGFCGSLTTWSALALRTASELTDGAWSSAVAWLTIEVAVGLGAAGAGRRLGRSRWQRTGTAAS